MIPNSKTRIMVFGTFDVLHKGHLNFFRQARKLSRRPFLVVSVARDVNVKKIKGRKTAFNQRQRLAAVKKTGLADRVVLGAIKNYLSHITKEKPLVIALGYDQEAYTKNLRRLLAARGLTVKIVRLKPYQPQKYKSSLVKGQ